MKTEDLRAIQAPLKERYKAEPDSALITLKAQGRLGEGITCNVQTGKALVAAGLHPAAGGGGPSARSGDMLPQGPGGGAGGAPHCGGGPAGGVLPSGNGRAARGLFFFGTPGEAT